MQPLETQRLINDPNRVSLLHRRYSYQARGCYLDQLRRWEEHLPRDRLLVVISEQVFREPAMVLPRVHTFLGLTEADPATFLPANVGRYANAKMAPVTQAELVAYYREPNAELARYLGIDLGWD